MIHDNNYTTDDVGRISFLKLKLILADDEKEFFSLNKRKFTS